MHINLKDQVVLITGGTQGIGLASALQFAQAGARTYLTYKWGTAEPEDLFRQFDEIQAPRPVLIEADVSQDADTDTLLESIAEKEKGVDIFISNVGFAQRTMSLDEYKKKTFFKTLEYSTWPLIEYTRKLQKKFQRYPRYIIGISSDGPDHFYPGYDFVAASKALLEFFSKYLSAHLFESGSRVNVIRFGTVKTDSFSKIFGEKFFEFVRSRGIPDDMILTPRECGQAVLALCSGLLDAMNGQIITLDKGMPFRDNLMMQYLSQTEGQPG